MRGVCIVDEVGCQSVQCNYAIDGVVIVQLTLCTYTLAYIYLYQSQLMELVSQDELDGLAGKVVTQLAWEDNQEVGYWTDVLSRY